MKFVKLFEQFVNTLNERRVYLKPKRLKTSDRLDIDTMIDDITIILRDEYESEFEDARETIEDGDFGVDTAMMNILYVQFLKMLEDEYETLMSQASNKNVKGGDFYYSWSLKDLKEDMQDNVKDIVKNKKTAIADALDDMSDFEATGDYESDVKDLEAEIEAAKKYRKSLDQEMELAVTPGMFDDDPEAYDKFGNEWGEKMNDADEEVERLEDELDDLKSSGSSGVDLDNAEKTLSKLYSKAAKKFEQFVKTHLLTI